MFVGWDEHTKLKGIVKISFHDIYHKSFLLPSGYFICSIQREIEKKNDVKLKLFPW